jgi:hypothetical protein
VPPQSNIKKHRVQLAGKRIFIRLRQEVDDGPNWYEEVKAVGPETEGRGGRQKGPNPFEAPS